MPSSVIPTLRYQDAPKMIDWLCDTIGFEKGLIVPDGDGGIAHAQLKLGDGMLMLGSTHDDEWGALQPSPAKLGGSTQSPYLVVPDVDAIYESVRAAGAEIVMDLEDKDYGGKGFGFKDPEGHLWSVGDYDPWEE